MAPHKEAQQCNRDRRVCDESVSEDPLVAMHTDQVADDSERWQNHDVHSRMAIEPEEMLERHRVPIVLWIENTDVHCPFCNEKQKGDTKNRSR